MTFYHVKVHLLVKKDNTQGAGKGLYFLVKILMFRYSIVSIQLMKASTLRREGRGERQELGKRLFFGCRYWRFGGVEIVL